MARAVMDQIVATGKVQRGRIGVSVQDLPDAMRAGGLQGALIGEVLPGSPAQQAGMRKGDVVSRIDDVPVRSASQLRNKVGLTPIGDVLQLTINRSGSTDNIAIAIGAPELDRVKAQGRRDR